MSLQAYVGTFSAPAANVTGSQTVTGIVDATGAAFTPTAILIWGQFDGIGSTVGVMEEWNTVGFSDGVHNYGQAIESRWSSGAPWRGTGTSTTYSILQLQSVFSAATRFQGAVTGFGSGSFTYRIDQNLDGQVGQINIFSFLALGGVTAKAGQAARVTGGTGPQAVTGIGFQPTGGFFFWDHGGFYNDSSGQQLALGWADTALNQYAFCSALAEHTTPGVAGASLLAGYVGVTNDNNAQTVTPQASVVSWDSDGFTLNYLQTIRWNYLVIGGAPSVTGSVTEPLTNGSQTIAPAGFTPATILFASVGQPMSTGWQANESVSIGAYDGTRQRAVWQGAQNGATQTSQNGGSNWGANQALVIGQSASTTLTQHGVLTGTSLGPSGFTGNWTQTDGVARQVIYFTFGSSSGGGGGGGGGGLGPLYVTDQTNVFDDAGDAFQAYVISPAVPLSGRIDIQSALRESHLVARAEPAVSVQMTLITDFGLALPVDSVDVSPLASETRVTRKFENMRNADLLFCQVQLGDAAPVSNYWSLESFAGIAQIEGER